ncbi:MAG TPA: cytochrome-c oxidase, cbb3-type subunit III [Rubrivivax sp.]|nr:cytochrome-c oxidase, cbb3-type subunit III [Burkholderiales bacterium]HNU11563.1 cytochrome-c oxidase, cbb3-type subunit III [Rubrivivax sp.]
MSTFWAGWVIFLICFNLGITFFLFLWAPRAKVPTLPDGTTGHVWANGALREGMARLPGWWIAISFAGFIAGFTYLALYPGFGNFKGALDWTSRGQLAADTAANDAMWNAATVGFAERPVEQLASNSKARAMGEVLYRDNCAACHGRAGQGSQALGAPSLSDDDWLYGGSGEAIVTSIQGGRHGVMPAWREPLGDDGVVDVANYVLSLSGGLHDAARAAAGKEKFATLCAACHGPDGKGNQGVGAPNLTDGIWLYGGDLDSVEHSIASGRSGTMPAWSERLSPTQIHLVAAYVYSLSRDGAPSGGQ